MSKSYILYSIEGVGEGELKEIKFQATYDDRFEGEGEGVSSATMTRFTATKQFIRWQNLFFMNIVQQESIQLHIEIYLYALNFHCSVVSSATMTRLEEHAMTGFVLAQGALQMALRYFCLINNQTETSSTLLYEKQLAQSVE